jgi:O-antigen/teichoic acid export membrane protein
LRGILEAQQRFRILNLIRIPMSIFSFAGPLLVLPFSHNLVPVIGVLVGGRFLGCLAHQVACFQAMPALWRGFALERSVVAPLLKFGGWMMVSNLVGPAILYGDRFLVGALVSLSAVAYYTVPLDLVSRFLVIPLAIAGVLFPAFAVSMGQDQNRTGVLLSRGVKYTFLAIFPLILITVTLAPEILRFWLGAAFAQNSGSVLRWLAVGILMNCVTVIPFALLQGIGRPDITGKLLLVELPIYLGIVWTLTTRFGIEGAAIAWTGRATVEALICLALSQRFLPKQVFLIKPLGIGATMAGSVLYVATFSSGLAVKGGFLACTLLAFVLVGWLLLLTPKERLFVARGRLGLALADSGAATALAGADTV